SIVFCEKREVEKNKNNIICFIISGVWKLIFFRIIGFEKSSNILLLFAFLKGKQDKSECI
ncbi:MAG TPA: hypothetical protein PLB11_05860, partial [Flavobacterium sp.]|nr:hypothetical protein [Flavobacterium sp.]